MNKKPQGLLAIGTFLTILVFGFILLLILKYFLKSNVPLLINNYFDILVIVLSLLFIIISLNTRIYCGYLLAVLLFGVPILSLLYQTIILLSSALSFYSLLGNLCGLFFYSLTLRYLILKKSYFKNKTLIFEPTAKTRRQELIFIILFVLSLLLYWAFSLIKP